MVPANLSKSVSFRIPIHKWTNCISVSCWIYPSGDSIPKEIAVLRVKDDEGHLHCTEYKWEHRFGKLLGLTETDGQSCLPVSSPCPAVGGTQAFSHDYSILTLRTQISSMLDGELKYPVMSIYRAKGIHKLLFYTHHGSIL